MSDYVFQHYLADGQEHFVYGKEENGRLQVMEKDFPFPESLLRMLYLDIWKLEPLFKEMDKALLDFMREKDWQYAEIILACLEKLAQEHIYFEFLRLDWQWRLEETMRKEFKGMYELLPRKQLRHIPSDVDTMQKQVMKLFEKVLDISRKKKSLPEKLSGYYDSAKINPLSVFEFQTLQTNFDTEVCAEILCPTSVSDFIDFSLRECIKQDLPMRVCKNCGRYFALTGRSNAEYCSVTRDEKGRTCKDIGAITLWTKTKGTDEVHKAYRREYKKRFAWINAGKISPSDFYAWSAQAKQKKAECDSGIISFDEFKAWLQK